MLVSLFRAVESGVAPLPGEDWARNGEATYFGLSDVLISTAAGLCQPLGQGSTRRAAALRESSELSGG